MTRKVKTSSGFSNIADRKISNGNGTFTDVKRRVVKQNGVWETVWERVSEEFKLTIDTRQTDAGLIGSTTTFSIPTSGVYAYDWNIDWGDGTVQRAIGTGSNTSAGITHTYATGGQYQITIKPAGVASSWFRAFGFWSNTNGANVQTNKNKVVSLDTPLTVSMFATPGATIVANDVCRNMFYSCRGVNFAPGTGFGFDASWNNVTTVGNLFCSGMFQSCNGIAFTMNSVFNLPQSITTVGTNFCQQMFQSCNGSVFTMNSVFNLPQSITTFNECFCYQMFSYCVHDNFQVNSVFRFPCLSPQNLSVPDMFYQTFYCDISKAYSRQNVSITQILNGNSTPTDARQTFTTYNATQGANRWSDWSSVAANWKS